MDYLISVLLVIGFGAVVFSNFKICQEVNKFHADLKTKLDDIVNDINDINNHLMDVKPKEKIK